MDFAAELTQMKNLLANVPTGNLPTPAPAPQNTPSAPAPIEQSNPVAPAPSAPATSVTTNTPLDDLIANPMGEGIELAKLSLDKVLESVQDSVKSELVAELLEKCKEFISQKYKWSPTLYEIGKIARQFKSKKDVAITNEDITNLKAEVEKWKEKL